MPLHYGFKETGFGIWGLRVGFAIYALEYFVRLRDHMTPVQNEPPAAHTRALPPVPKAPQALMTLILNIAPVNC